MTDAEIKDQARKAIYGIYIDLLLEYIEAGGYESLKKEFDHLALIIESTEQDASDGEKHD